MFFTRSFVILIALISTFHCFGKTVYEGENYILTIDKHISIGLRKNRQAKIVPLISQLKLSGHDKKWHSQFIPVKTSVKASSEQPDGSRKITVSWHFNGKFISHVKAKTEIQCFPRFLFLKSEIVSDTSPENIVHTRCVFMHGCKWTGLFQAGNLGLKVKSIPAAHMFNSANHSGYSIKWEQKNGKHVAKTTILMVPYSGNVEPKLPERLEEGNLSELFLLEPRFPRVYNVYFDGETPAFKLYGHNYSLKKVNCEWNGFIYNFDNQKVFRVSGGKNIMPGKDISIPVNPATLMPGWYTLKLDYTANAKTYTINRSFCIIPSPQRQFQKDSIFGIQPFVWTLRDKNIMDAMQWLGCNWVRMTWGAHPLDRNRPEKINGKYTVANARKWHNGYSRRGLDVTVRSDHALDFPPGIFRMTEGMNERNIKHLPVEIAEQIKLDYIRLKQHDPNIKVGSPSSAGIDMAWWGEIAENGCWDYLDYLNVHLHCFPFAPEVNNSMTRYFWLADRVKLMNNLFKQYGDRPVLDSEHGYLVLNDARRPEKYPLRMVSTYRIAAAFMVRSYLQAMAYGLIGKEWFTLSSYGGFGLIEKDQPMPGFAAYAVMTKVLDGAKYCGELIAPGYVGNSIVNDGKFTKSWFGLATAGKEKEFLGTSKGDLAPELNKNIKPYVYARCFEQPDGSPLLACWATLKQKEVYPNKVNTPAWSGQEPGKSVLWNGQVVKKEPAPIPLKLNIGSDQVTVIDIMGRKRQVKCPGGVLTLSLNDYPQYVMGASNAVIKEAKKHRLTIFTSKFPETKWLPVVQALLPPGKKYPQRKNVYDSANIAATIPAGKSSSFYVRITNLDKKVQTGSIKLKLPKNWQCSPQKIKFSLDPGKKRIFGPFAVTPDSKTAKAKLSSEVSTDALGKLAPSFMNVTVK